MTITLELFPDQEARLRRVAKTQGKDLDAFLLQSVQGYLRPDILPENEANLLAEINAPLPAEAKRERDTLLGLQKQRELSEGEQSRLFHLIDLIELAQARRWQCLAELADRRESSLVEIAQELEIPLS